MGRVQRILLLAGATMLSTAWLTPANSLTCGQQATQDYLACKAQCKSDFIDARLTCRNIQPACGEACLAGRQACLDNVQSILDTGKLPDGSDLPNCLGGTNACRAAFRQTRSQCPGITCDPSGTNCSCNPNDMACNDCVDNAQVTDFQCRDTCRDSWRTNATVMAMQQSCAQSFQACIKKCPPAS